MNKKSYVFLVALAMIAVGMVMVPGDISAKASQNSVRVMPINEKISLQETVTTMSVPEGNKLPWGFVSGGASEYVERYPVIIQFYKGEDPVHFAQVGVKGDGSYEYKFRVRSIDDATGEFVNVFEGDYTVKIFRVIPNTSQLV